MDTDVLTRVFRESIIALGRVKRYITQSKNGLKACTTGDIICSSDPPLNTPFFITV